MPRLVHESGTKFWSITLKGKQYSTTYGKVGTPGQTRAKQFATAAKAKAAYALAVLMKHKAGYVVAK